MLDFRPVQVIFQIWPSIEGVSGREERHGKRSLKTVQSAGAVHRYVVMRPNGHHLGRGYNFKQMPFIWCTPQVLLCQSHIYKVLNLPSEN